jgi:hypothetical protein
MTRFGCGQSGYDEHNTYGGIIICQPDFSQAPHLFQIFNTHLGILNPLRRSGAASE